MSQRISSRSRKRGRRDFAAAAAVPQPGETDPAQDAARLECQHAETSRERDAAASANTPAGDVRGAAGAAPIALRHLPVQRMPQPRANAKAEQDAQSLTLDAWDLPVYSAKRERLIECALQLCPDLPDALVSKCDRWLFQPGSRDPARALPFLEYALVAAADRLGSDYIRLRAGSLYAWVIDDSYASDWGRPYMRALFAYMHALWDLKRKEEAIAYAHECLRLNSSDNQGVRYVLSTWLLEQNDLDGAQTVLDLFPDDAGAHLKWNRVLLLFKRGWRDAATTAAREAEGRNRFVRIYLMGVAQPPANAPAYTTMSGDSEAAEYAREGIKSWRETPDAIKWLASI